MDKIGGLIERANIELQGYLEIKKAYDQYEKQRQECAIASHDLWLIGQKSREIKKERRVEKSVWDSMSPHERGKYNWETSKLYEKHCKLPKPLSEPEPPYSISVMNHATGMIKYVNEIIGMFDESDIVSFNPEEKWRLSTEYIVDLTNFFRAIDCEVNHSKWVEKIEGRNVFKRLFVVEIH
jgi:hypothetical protein